jgi:hypothetical protein
MLARMLHTPDLILGKTEPIRVLSSVPRTARNAPVGARARAGGRGMIRVEIAEPGRTWFLDGLGPRSAGPIRFRASSAGCRAPAAARSLTGPGRAGPQRLCVTLCVCVRARARACARAL